MDLEDAARLLAVLNSQKVILPTKRAMYVPFKTKLW